MAYLYTSHCPPNPSSALQPESFLNCNLPPTLLKTHRWLPTACKVPKDLSLAFPASHHLNLAVAGSPSSFLPLSSPLTLMTWALGTFYLCALADAVPSAWNSLRLQGSALMVAPLQRLWGRSWQDSFLGLPWLRGKSKVAGLGSVGDLRLTQSQDWPSLRGPCVTDEGHYDSQQRAWLPCPQF